MNREVEIVMAECMNLRGEKLWGNMAGGADVGCGGTWEGQG